MTYYYQLSLDDKLCLLNLLEKEVSEQYNKPGEIEDRLPGMFLAVKNILESLDVVVLVQEILFLKKFFGAELWTLKRMTDNVV